MSIKLPKYNLSPGCISCIEGSWACVFLNSFCTRRCFYCPQNRDIKIDHKPSIDGVYFNNVQDFLDFIKKFHFKTVAFSGGEPLLAFELLISFLRKIRKKFGSKIYIWIYTNGDLVTEKKLKILKELGLDEIRFDLSARRYDFTPIILARKIFKNVVIETPAIPEDKKELIKSLLLMQKYAITKLNLHELIMTEFNKKEFLKRGYTFKKNNGVVESGKIAIKIYKYILEKKLNINLNYCTTSYKNHYQGRGINMRYSCCTKTSYESITNNGHLRQIYLKFDKKPVLFWEKIPCSEKKHFYFDDNHGELHIPPSLLKEADIEFWEGQKLNIVYYDAVIKNNRRTFLDEEKIIKINKNFSIKICRKICKKIVLTKNMYLYVFAKGILAKRSLIEIIKDSFFRKKFLEGNSLNLYREKLEDLAIFYSLFEDLEF